MTERHVKLFKNGRNQVVRIPRDFELPGEDAIIRKDGQRLKESQIKESIRPRHFRSQQARQTGAHRLDRTPL